MTPERIDYTNEGLLSSVREQLRSAAVDVLRSALVQLESGATTPAPRPRWYRVGRRPITIDRMREVLERDRALRTAAPPEATSSAAVHRMREILEHDRALRQAVPDDDVDLGPQTSPELPACDEVVRTRTMAKLLAAQGHRDRALSIYRYLIALDGSDASLRVELAELEAAFHE